MNTNMVHSLYLGLKKIVNNKSELIICYSDIIFNSEVLKKLINTKKPISVVCDDDWKNYWSLRFRNPLDDAESCLINKENKILELGQKTKSYKKINSQYVGLIKINYICKKKILKILENEYNNRFSKSNILKNKYYSNLYLTDLIQYLIHNNFKIYATRIKGNWLEIDSIKDYKISLKLTKKENNILRILR